MTFDQFISSHNLLVSIILYVLIIAVVFYYKPYLFYNTDGSLKQFGIGYKNKTILPIWLFFIVLGILCYLTILYYSALLQFS
jgi:hypothetical protein